MEHKADGSGHGDQQKGGNKLAIHGLESKGPNFTSTYQDAINKLADGVEVNLTTQDANLDAALAAIGGALLALLAGEFVVNHGGSLGES